MNRKVRIVIDITYIANEDVDPLWLEEDLNNALLRAIGDGLLTPSPNDEVEDFLITFPKEKKDDKDEKATNDEK